MKALYTLVALGGLLLTATLPAVAEGDEAAITALVQNQAAAWNAGDPHAYAATFAPDGSFVNVRGASFRGHDAFEQRHAEIFTSFFRGSRQALRIDRLTLLSGDSAFAEISTEVSGYAALPPGIPPPPDGVMRTRLLEVFKKTDGHWLVEAYYNINVLPTPPGSGAPAPAAPHPSPQ